MASVAVVGVGAIGGVVAAALAKAKTHELLLCTRRPFDRLVVDDPGGLTELSVQTLVEPTGVERVDFVLLATKAHQTQGAAAWLGRLCDATTTVAVLQNGVEHHERVAPLVGGATVVPCIVDCPATRPEPGRVKVTRALTVQVPATSPGRQVVELLSHVGLDATVTADFLSAAWRKLCVNVVSGPIPALCDKPRGVFRHPPVTELARTLVRECYEVGVAEGANLDADLVETVVRGRCNGPADAVTSMLMDRRAGRLLETDSRNGAVVRVGARHGIATPANAFVLAVLSAINRPGLDR